MTVTVTKAEIAEGLQRELNISKLVAKEIVDEVFEEIRVKLEQGAPVKISRFGNFVLRDKKNRPGRNPKTGEDKIIEARRVVTFKTGQKLKQRLEKLNSIDINPSNL